MSFASLLRKKLRRARQRSMRTASFPTTFVSCSRKTTCSVFRFRRNTAASAVHSSRTSKSLKRSQKRVRRARLIVAVQELGALPILIGGNEQQKQQYIPKLASGEWIAAYALTETGSGSDAAGSMRARAEKRGDKYILNGTKIFITHGNVADVVCAFAVTDPKKGPNGISAFILEKTFPGFVVGKREKKMGIRGSPTVELVFENCEVPAENLLGQEGEGFKIAMKVLDKSRPGIAAQALGIAAGALDFATNYAQERIAFGKPIGQQQGVRFFACRHEDRS